MSPRPARFRQVDVTRAVRAAQASGLKVGRIEIGADGKIIVIAAEEFAPPAIAPELPALERWKAKRALKNSVGGSDYERAKTEQKEARAERRNALKKATVKSFLTH